MGQVIKSTTFPEGLCVDNGNGTNSLTDRCVDGQPCECVENLDDLGRHFVFASTHTGELLGVPFVSTEDFSQKINEAIAGAISDITEQSSILTRGMMVRHFVLFQHDDCGGWGWVEAHHDHFQILPTPSKH
jgi:hypothetical protein